jgi:hypothetical protein
LEECFSDHYAFRDVKVEGSLVRDIMTSRHLRAKDGSEDIFIPYLVMFGILYCASNTDLKVQKFYEGAQIDLDAQIKKDDPELLDLFEKILSISYDMMIELYLKHKNQDEPIISEKFILPPTQSKLVYEAVRDDVIADWFGSSFALTKEDF